MKKILIINANYYKNISLNLVNDAKRILKKSKVQSNIIEVAGIFEIPVTARKYINKYDGFVALTPHFEFICKSTFDSILNISIKYNKPIGNGIITALNMNQAKSRSSVGRNLLKSNKGSESAKAVISVLKNEPKKT